MSRTIGRCDQYLEAGYLAMARRDHAGAEAAFQAAIAEAEALGPESEQMAASLSNLGQLRYREGNFTGAVEALRRALEIRERLLGPDQYGIVENSRNLVAAYV